MSETKWTPGPWELAEYREHEGFSIWAHGAGCIAERWWPSPVSDVPIKSIARLIQSAPLLYDALADIMKCVDAGVLVRDTSRDHEMGWALHQLPLVLSLKAGMEALAKARGEA